MSQDLVDDVLVFNTPVRRIGDDPDRASATTANFNVDIEYALESFSPCHRRVTLSR
jgi:hypothetical protein